MDMDEGRNPATLVRQSRRTGSWHDVGAWLATSLNDLDSSIRAGATARSARQALMWDRIAVAAGDHRDVDLILLPDGTRVCWHLSKSRRATGWVVERRGERCVFPAS